MTYKFEIILFYLTVLSTFALFANSVLGIVYFATNHILSNFILSIYILPFAAYGLCTQMDLTVTLNSNKRFAIFYIIAGSLGLGLSFPSFIISLYVITNGFLYFLNEYLQRKRTIDEENEYVKHDNIHNVLSPPPLTSSHIPIQAPIQSPIQAPIQAQSQETMIVPPFDLK
jgi:hypothetical protein